MQAARHGRGPAEARAWLGRWPLQPPGPGSRVAALARGWGRFAFMCSSTPRRSAPLPVPGSALLAVVLTSACGEVRGPAADASPTADADPAGDGGRADAAPAD